MLTMVPGMALSVNSIAFYPDAQEAKPNVFVRIMCKRLGVLATPRVNPIAQPLKSVMESPAHFKRTSIQCALILSRRLGEGVFVYLSF